MTMCKLLQVVHMTVSTCASACCLIYPTAEEGLSCSGEAWVVVLADGGDRMSELVHESHVILLSKPETRSSDVQQVELVFL